MSTFERPRSVLILGSGPVVIGQAAEFDYAGTQACRALREEGVRTILLNSNPATIMTDPGVADVVYLEPLTVEVAERILERERPEGVLAGLGGQTGAEPGHGPGARRRPGALRRPAAGHAARGHRDGRGPRALPRPARPDRPAVRAVRDRRGTDEADLARATDRALEVIGLPAVIRPAFTLGGTGGGIVATEAEYRERVRSGLRASPIHQVMVERCLVGWQEIEYEVMRDADDTCIAVCSMENVDPLGVHTGDSIVVAPVQTLPDPVHQRLRSAALAIIRALGVEGGCNVQFALSPDSAEYAVIEVNPRVSRSSALASKATGYPIARVAAQIAIGRRLAEIPNAITGTTVAAFEPALDYVVVKLPRFPFDKFPTADRSLGSQMKATGEVMAIDRTFGAGAQQGAPRPGAGGCRVPGRGSRLGTDAGAADARPRRGRRRSLGARSCSARSSLETTASSARTARTPRRSPDPAAAFPRPVRLAAVAAAGPAAARRAGNGAPGRDRHRALVRGRDGAPRGRGRAHARGRGPSGVSGLLVSRRSGPRSATATSRR